MIRLNELPWSCRYGGSFNTTKNLLEEYGYYSDSDPKGYDRETVLNKLKALSEVRPEVEEDLLLWWEHPISAEENYQGVYLASPVMLAMLLKEYELAEKLVDKGYSASDLLTDTQYYCEEQAGMGWSVKISLSQLLMSQMDIPKRLFAKLCEQLMYDGLDYVFDYWLNPFLMTSAEVIERKIIPSMLGFRRIWEYNRELLRGMLKDFDTHNSFWSISGKFKECKKLIRHLIFYFAGMGEDMMQILNVIRCEVERCINYNKVPPILRFCIQVLPELKEACSYEEDSEQAFFETTVKLYLNLCKQFNFVNRQQREKMLANATAVLETCCPSWYQIEDYMHYLLEKMHWSQYADMLGIWKYVVKKPIKFEKTEWCFWELLEKLFGKKIDIGDDEDDYELCEDYRIYRRTERISESIRFLEHLNGTDWIYDSSNEDEIMRLSNLISTMIDLNSEELLLTCLNVNLIPKEIVPELTKCALAYGGKKLLPVLLLHQNRK